MPLPGQANNPDGINSFSGPNGEQEPQYGAVERLKAAESAVPVRSPGASAPRKAQRRAVSGKGGGSVQAGVPAAALSPPLPGADTHIQAEQQQVAFWTTLLDDPDSSPLTRQYAERALGYA